ncbi:unnamed protein product [Caenorhabditis nigoni]
MTNRSVDRPCKDATSYEGSSKVMNLKRRRPANSPEAKSDKDVQIAQRCRGRQRKVATVTQGSFNGINEKRTKPSSFSESEEDNVQEKSAKRRAAKRVTYNESHFDSEKSPIEKKTEKSNTVAKNDALPSESSESESDLEPSKRKFKSARRAKDAVQTKIMNTDSEREASSRSSSSDSSSSELEFDFGDSALEEITDNELAEEFIQETISKRMRTRKAKNENKRHRMRFTDKQKETLMAVFRETEFPSEEQKEKLAKETNRTIHQIEKWFNNKRQSMDPGRVKKHVGRFTVEQKLKMNEVYATNSNPDKETIASLTAELNLTEKQIKKYFYLRRERKLIPGGIPQNQFLDVMRNFFEERQFLEKPNQGLELKSGGSWNRISNWLKENRYTTLEAFFKKEISVLPVEMETFEKLAEKYCLNVHTHTDVILFLERQEDVNGDSLAQYIDERSFVLEMLENHRTGEVHANQEEENLSDPQGEKHSEEPVLDYEMNEGRWAEKVAHHEENEMEIETDGNGIDIPDEAPVEEECHDQIDDPVSENPPPEVKNIQRFENSREDNQNSPLVNRTQNEFVDFPEETKNVPLFAPAPGYRDQGQEPLEDAAENDVKPHRENCDRIQAQYFRK